MITDTAFYRNHNYHEVTDTWDTLAVVHVAAGEDLLALRAYERVLAETLDSAQHHHRLAQVQERLGRGDAARESLGRAIALGGFAELDDARATLARLEAQRTEPRE